MPFFSFEQLDSFFEIHGVSETTQRFSSYIEPQSFFENTVPNPHHALPYIYVGGTMRHNASVAFHTDGLPFYLLLYITEGECRITIDEHSFALDKNSILFTCPSTKIQLDTLRSPLAYELYLADGAVLEAYHDYLSSDNNEEKSSFYSNKIQGNYFHSLLLQVNHLLKHPSDDSNFYISKFLQDILTECIHTQDIASTGRPDTPSHVLRMQLIFEKKYMAALTLDSLEAEIGINKYRLCRDFSKHMGISPLQYLNRKRINAAKDLLKHSDMTIHAVGASVGIPNTNHFINLFQRDTGVTPLQFRNAYTHTL